MPIGEMAGRSQFPPLDLDAVEQDFGREIVEAALEQQREPSPVDSYTPVDLTGGDDSFAGFMNMMAFPPGAVFRAFTGKDLPDEAKLGVGDVLNPELEAPNETIPSEEGRFGNNVGTAGAALATLAALVGWGMKRGKGGGGQVAGRARTLWNTLNKPLGRSAAKETAAAVIPQAGKVGMSNLTKIGLGLAPFAVPELVKRYTGKDIWELAGFQSDTDKALQQAQAMRNIEVSYERQKEARARKDRDEELARQEKLVGSKDAKERRVMLQQALSDKLRADAAVNEQYGLDLMRVIANPRLVLED